MKNHIVSAVSLLVAVTAVILASSARREVEAIKSEYKQSAVSREGDRAQPAKTDRDEKIAALTARVEALEKEVWSDSKIQLLADIGARLQSDAKGRENNSQEIRAVADNVKTMTHEVQEAFNEVGVQFTKLNGEVSRMKEAK